jgi:bifunctional non-homologous end joining protein LigD
VPRTPFFPIATPKLAKDVPSGPEWLHEIKFDGFRLQIHKHGPGARLFSRNGADFTSRYPRIAAAAERMPARSAIIDAELVACDADDNPDFYALMFSRPGKLCAWCFDLLMLDGEDLRPRPLVDRRRLLADILTGETLRYSAHFEDGEKLLAAAEARGLEGIVSKRLGAAYIAGNGCGWLKIKTASWRAANRDRHELFEK